MVSKLPILLRLELLLFALGYMDRVAVLACGLLAILLPGLNFLKAALAFWLATPFLQVAVALGIADVSATMWRSMAILPLFFLVDAAMAVRSLLPKPKRQV